jgi:phosphoglycolate phosphatase
MVGDGARQLVERALEAAGVSTDVPAALARFLGIYSERLFVHTRPYPGLSDAVRALSQEARLAVLTNKPEGLTRRLLEGFGLSDSFQSVIGGDSAFPRKPDPAGLLHLIREAGVTAEATIMVGDSMIDVETARAAGAVACVAMYGFGHLRRAIVLRGDELIATRAADVHAVLAGFLEAQGRRR